MLDNQTIDKIIDSVWNKNVLIGFGSIIIARWAFKSYQKRQDKMTKDAYPKDVVILHQFPRGKYAPR